MHLKIFWMPMKLDYFIALCQLKQYAKKMRNAIEGKCLMNNWQCSSMTRSKEPPFIISKSTKVQCFKGIHLLILWTQWKVNCKYWMNSDLMIEKLHVLNRKMHHQKKNIYIFAANATLHPNIELSNVCIVKCNFSLWPIRFMCDKNFKGS